MVKEKKMSKSSIAVIILAVLLVLSLVLGLTGAWFTSNGGKQGSEGGVTLTFGNVTYVLTAASTTVQYNGTEDTAAHTADADKLLVAGTEIETSVNYTNSSNVASYYALFDEAGKMYVINADGNALVEVIKTGSGHMTAAEAFGDNESLGYNDVGEVHSISRKYRVKEAAQAAYAGDTEHDAATAMSAAFEVWIPAAGNVEAHWDDINVTLVENYDYNGVADPDVIEYDKTVDLGVLLVNGEFELVAIQADNIAGADAFDALVAGRKAQA